MNLRSCTALAASLSVKYQTYEEFRVGDDLNQYLNGNGLLLSLCTSFRWLDGRISCELKQSENRVAASWVQSNITGWRLFETILGWPSEDMGVVLDPTGLDIACLYPADSGSNNRDGDGCGPIASDPKYGSQGYDHHGFFQRLLDKAPWYFVKESRFHTVKWEDIPCDDFLGMPANALNVTVLGGPSEGRHCDDFTEREFVANYESFVESYVKNAGYIMKHPICATDSLPDNPRFTIYDWLLYQGECFWRPQRWSNMIDAMKSIITEHPDSRSWNEIVLKKPTDDSYVDRLQAVFFTSDDTYPVAVAEARRLKKPLLQAHPHEPSTNTHIFTCNTTFVPDMHHANKTALTNLRAGLGDGGSDKLFQ